MEPASALIDEAADLAAERKVDEAVEKYRLALTELDRIEREHPDRVKKPEFATLRNKRAYVNAAIDSLLLGQVKAHAQSVAVSDTTELERRLAEEKSGKKEKPVAKAKPAAKEKPAEVAEPAVKAKPAEKAKPRVKGETKREQAMAAIADGDFATAEGLVAELLKQKPNGVTALNLKAALMTRQGKLKEAEEALDQAITSNPHNYFAYYNMAWLMLKKGPDGKSSAKKYYETGRAMGGGPKDAELEEAVK